MIDPTEILKTNSKFEFHKNRIMDYMEHYAAMCWQTSGTVIPRYHALMYDFERKDYQEYAWDNIPLTSREDYDKTYKALCHMKWMHGLPTVFSVLILPIDISMIHSELILDRRKGMVMFVQNELQTKFGIYLYKNSQMEWNQELTRYYQPPPYILRMGYLIGTSPMLN